jgi:hypothetical protein
MNASFVDRYLEQGKRFCWFEQSVAEMSSEELLAIIGYLSQWAPDEGEINLQRARDLPPSNDGLLEG